MSIGSTSDFRKGSQANTTKNKLSGHDPVRKKVGASATTMASTYDARKGSQAPKPPKTKKDPVQSKIRDTKIRDAAKKRRVEQRAAKRAAMLKKRKAKQAARLARK